MSEANLDKSLDKSPVLENISVVKKASVYFDGKVTSRTVQFTDGSHKTLGIMLPGEYTFGTQEKEIMEIQAGDLEVLIGDDTSWQTIQGGEQFTVSANSQFQLKVYSVTDYICSYIK
ncbi:pyrimidine/purine nucleoside phosphorylase [Thalassotalea euphylliae]|uniref:Pyrimidine/purine nucleoside phosphorylase n=1 Tax=Thalassotalea euphylliae TaxID=1655234 RepID=A0A3E0UGW4_9GAMM|nr:pyrimidine/purine nucleoside phosphorylase [Thalassotalea euphylliae]REL36291.1 pyrimidine/purine nucleoside phosphorylase [Thalassotalea euphylliae]